MDIDWEKVIDDELKWFYGEYFDQDNLSLFLKDVYSMDWDDRIPRRMISQIHRFVTLAQRIEEIYPPRDGLRILFLRMCLESLLYLDDTIGNKNKNEFFDKYYDCLSDEACDYILNGFHLTGYTGSSNFDNDGFVAMEAGSLTISDFFRIMKYVRDQVAHEGNFWSFQMFSDREDVHLMTELKPDNKLTKAIMKTGEKEVFEFHFDSTLQFDRFIHYFTDACINYVKRYMDDHHSDSAAFHDEFY